MNNDYIPQGGAPATPPPFFIKPPKKSYTWIWVSAAVALVFLLMIFGFIFISILGDSNKDDEVNNEFSAPSDDFIAVIPIQGTIASSSDVSLFNSSSGTYNHQYVLETIKNLKASKTNKGIMLFIDSPGGEIYAVDEVYLALEDYKASTGRPIYAYCATYAASGGYYLAVTAEHISANRMGTLGSIGVTYGTHLDLSGLLEKYGITATAITSGDNKAMGDITQPLTEEQLKIYQSQIDEYYEVFVDVVDRGRATLNRTEVYALADGRTYTARQSLANGLIDSIGDFNSAVATMIEKCGLDKNIRFVTYEYVYTSDYGDLLQLLGESLSSSAGVEIDPSDLSIFANVRYSLKGALVYYNGK